MSRYVGIMYKIKKYLPLSARLQIYHSFIQSHLNYCSLVWGFTCKSNIEALFSKQKRGLRAVIPGFINYKFKDGNIPGHTKQYFTKYEILTIHGIITLNTYLFIRKIRHFPHHIPPSIVATIPADSPMPDSTFDTCSNWLKRFDNHLYRNSVFYKGPLLVLSPMPNTSPAGLLNLNKYKNDMKYSILMIQGGGDAAEWENDNFPIFNIQGLRRSNVNYRIAVNYTE